MKKSKNEKNPKMKKSKNFELLRRRPYLWRICIVRHQLIIPEQSLSLHFCHPSRPQFFAKIVILLSHLSTQFFSPTYFFWPTNDKFSSPTYSKNPSPAYFGRVLLILKIRVLLILVESYLLQKSIQKSDLRIFLMVIRLFGARLG